MPTDTLESAAHVVQLALTPALLNVFASRLGRVADQTDMLAAQAQDEPGRDQRLHVLRLRSHALDFAVVLGGLAGALSCGAILTLFLGAVRGEGAADLLFTLFGGAVILTMGALIAYVVEMTLATRGVRRLVNRTIDETEDATIPRV
jgi:hypothetical protein